MNAPIQVALLRRAAEPRRAVQKVLSFAGFRASTFEAGADLIQSFSNMPYDLLLIDQEPSDIPAADVIRAVRGKCSRDIPIMMLSENDSEDGLIEALDAGADDFVAGPLSERALMARIAALRRRAGGGQTSRGIGLRAGDYELNSIGRFATLRGKRIAMTPKEFDLAVLLFANVGRVLANKRIEYTIWGHELPPLSRALAGLVSRMRRTLDLCPSNGVTISVAYAKGYRLDVLDDATVTLLSEQAQPN